MNDRETVSNEPFEIDTFAESIGKSADAARLLKIITGSNNREYLTKAHESFSEKAVRDEAKKMLMLKFDEIWPDDDRFYETK